MDLFTTSIKLAGGEIPHDRPIDGVDLRAALTGTGPVPPRVLFCYWDTELRAVRKGAYKAHFITGGAYGEGGARTEHNPPLLFDLNEDPGERYNVAAQRPEVVADLQKEVETHRRGLKLGPPLFDARAGTGR